MDTAKARLIRAESRRQTLDGVRRAQAMGLTIKAEFTVADDRRACGACLMTKGKVFEPDDFPELPLPGCDREPCMAGVSPWSADWEK
jgi:hypothetical protein